MSFFLPSSYYTGVIEVIPFSSFQRGIAPLWYADEAPENIPIYNNPYRIIAYPVDEQASRVLYYAVRYSEDGVTKCYSSVYNISDTVLRIRGIYVLPDHRGVGAGHRMVNEMVNLFPETFHRVVGFWREDSCERFIEHSRMSIVPGTDWIWSEFSKVNMRFLYRDRGPRPSADQVEANRVFIQQRVGEHGFGGRMNLDRKWSNEEWRDFVTTHQGSYPDLGIDLHF
jgi:GNAT superfamily N-acetyltransferase